ncbi:MAG: hypothetical protein DLM61_13290 [Pseudonocardiales bacterium]|nr:MAG: hypothetical protein DLM61_13290 [Pseudonocardiales bacterium]
MPGNADRQSALIAVWEETAALKWLLLNRLARVPKIANSERYPCRIALPSLSFGDHGRSLGVGEIR